MKAFLPDAASLVSLVIGTFKGDAKLLGVIAEKGCGRDPMVLKTLADTFKADPKPLQDMIAEGGLGAHPEAFAALLDAGCDKDPVKLQALCGKFADGAAREKLAGVVGKGGLAEAPAALGALAKEGAATSKGCRTTSQRMPTATSCAGS